MSLSYPPISLLDCMFAAELTRILESAFGSLILLLTYVRISEHKTRGFY